MREKWKAGKKGYLNIHIAVDIKSKKILSIKVTADEHVHDNKALPELVNGIMELDKKITIGKLFADDGAYEGNDIFRYLADKGIQPCIKVRKNARVRWRKGHILRNLSFLAQRNDLQKWKDSIVSYGQRWIVEMVFSSIKRMFDREYAYSIKLKNISGNDTKSIVV